MIKKENFWLLSKMTSIFVNNYDAIYILFYTGMRISEFTGLTINDIDLKAKKINIEYKGDNVIIEQDSIICIESLVRKRYIKTDTQSYISLKSLSYWQSVLDEDKIFFLSINPSLLI